MPAGMGGIEAVRLGSVLAFIAYLFAGIRLARQFGNGTLRLCFIAASVNFPVHHEPVIRLADDPASA